MMLQQYVTQPWGAVTYLSLFDVACQNVSHSNFDVAVAYATLSGVELIAPLVESWHNVKKRWLVGVDWCRTEPLALDKIASFPNSEVRIHDGEIVVDRSGCVPLLPFHPKTFILRSSDATAIIAGSGNLSNSGLSRGHEFGTLLLLKKPLAVHEKPSWKACQQVFKWFNHEWSKASALDKVRDRYQEIYERSTNLRVPVPVDDDASPTPHRRALTPNQLQKVRVCRHLWIEAGNLHKNRGPGKPGNQLMLSPMTRVFFGFPARDLPRDTLIGHAKIEYDGHLRPDCSLRFSNNSMDVLTLPIPGTEGPSSYDQKTILFEKIVKSGTRRFLLKIGNKTLVKQWRQHSQSVSADYAMSSGRKWGAF